MEKRLPPQLETMALSTLLSYIISVLDENQKERLNQMAKLRPIEVPEEGATPEVMDYISDMQEFIRNTIKLGLGQE
ncbi:hypothetical protein NUU98_18020 [Cronobacter sakazakii]|uniref:hypothetical protein n=1 Tax=Cronobacter sakazakii TaxID=28141 RepID=UPI0009B1C340|nr:hypothetical protein [Cronobacter sakazakii]MDQ1933486.1 hypothetical protein [Cronobacter sakazakii]MDQ1937900.1 hypothetical protein [Cronobacter sakazakii]MDQ1942013.1 hypothetical protein [Cronobacter sakazakii]MDQ1946250.1 hypothetical protein [Cronobacter sakazakii]MDQ1950476.1 hypothetical protein [Cronobacter sakazakii]